MCPGVMSDAHNYRDTGKGASTMAMAAGTKDGINGFHPPGKKMAGSDEKRPSSEELAVLAPPLPHITMGFYSLSKLVSRLAQDTHNRLHDILESASEGTDPTRKLKLINFFMERRQQFIKLLVLTLYAKKSGDVSGVIDIKVWFDGLLDRGMGELIRDMWSLRVDFTKARVPNPDLKTALEVFTEGSTSNTKSYGFIPPPKLQPQELLRLFHKLDTILSFRFAIHDPPPPHFRNYKIHSGRAIFNVEHEFEAAFSIANEDHESQLFLVDFKLTFKPDGGNQLSPFVWNQIEAHGNNILREKKLPGIYEFLHEFAMTHKITILSQQVQKMMTGKWINSLQLTPIKRSIKIKYWPERIDSKSWIDIGILAPRRDEPSRIGVRWTRDGQDVTDEIVPIDIGNLSAESVVKCAIALHTKHLLSLVYNKLLQLPVFTPSRLTLKTSSTDSIDSYLKIMMTATRHVTLSIEPITGRLLLRKSNPQVHNTEQYLNKAPIKTAHEILGRLRRVIVTEELSARLRSAGWDTLKLHNIRTDDARKWFNNIPMALNFMRRKTWKEGWVLVCVVGDVPETWWVAKLQDAPLGWTIADAKQLTVDTSNGLTYELVNNLEKISSAFICEYTNCQVLNKKAIRYTLKGVRGSNDSPNRIPNILIQTSSIAEANWAKDYLRVRFMGLDASGKANLVVEGQAKEPMTQLKMRDMSSSDADVTFHTRSGGFALKFTIAVGDTVIDEVVERLQRIKRLIRFVSVIRRFQLSCRHVSLGRIDFIYTTNPIRTAEITFSGDNLQLNLPKDSPHLRIKPFLETVLNEKGLENVIFQLLVTRTLLVALHDLEQSLPESQLQIITRSPEWYRLIMPRGVKNFGFIYIIDIRLQCRRSEYWWHIKDVLPRSGDGPNSEPPMSPLRSLWMERFTPGMEGFKTGMAANLENIGRAIHAIYITLGFDSATHKGPMGAGLKPQIAMGPPNQQQQKHLAAASANAINMPSPGKGGLPTVVRKTGPPTGSSQDDALTID